MDQLPPFGTAVANVLRPTWKIYEGLLEKNAGKIKSTPRKTFSYGSDPRQELDVYFPSSNPSGSGCPLLMFLYGGGLINGSKRLPTIKDGLAYANLGHFFADSCGFVTMIIDYRLVPQARFPSGGEDVATAIDWTRANLKELGGNESTRDLFLMGNSAGGIHISTYLFGSVFETSRKAVLSQEHRLSLRLRGAVLLSVPLHFQAAAAERYETLTTYYGNRVEEDCPFGLLKSLKKKQTVDEALPGVKFLAMIGELDPEDELLIPNKDFAKLWETGNTSDNLQVEVMQGHNHISPPFAVGTGDSREEAWGFQVAKFCKSITGQ